jgi:hypothetical protein
VSIWSTVPASSLPAGALDLNTYAPNQTECVKGHRFASEADCILPEDEVDAWDYFLCRRCVEALGEHSSNPREDSDA